MQIERIFSSNSFLTICPCIDVITEDASSNWIFLLCLFWYFKEVVESTSMAPGVGLEPTSLGRHQLSYFYDLEADPF